MRYWANQCRGNRSGHTSIPFGYFFIWYLAVFASTHAGMYEFYPFYNVSAAARPPSPLPPLILPPPPPLGFCFITWRSKKKYDAIAEDTSFCFITRRSKKKYDAIAEDTTGNDITTVESFLYSLGIVQAATNNFSTENKIGEGGFGLVYKGTLSNGQEAAVKRLSRTSGQGAEEFKNENIFAIQCEDPLEQEMLNWVKRYKIIGGIARGMLYLHEDSQLRIIHCDLKASNVLLDGDMNAKISDFGMAKIFAVDQTQGNRSQVVRTYGYMSPEYAMHGQFFVKSDVFSFGVLVLKIISGKKNNTFYESGSVEDLLSSDLIQEVKSYDASILACCVQEDPEDRPSMATMVLMLNSYSVTLTIPQQPAFFARSKTESMPKSLDSDQSANKSIS
ncbi:hypothetical protein TEA_009722 [Camellia sinensis var. sinensis]|uniref:non-specific serine/threonine protein kinase n=1 Tax=Camellia sinensis var. sinensis TaxID=542762 RepID=A0A4V3WQ51_CAMSN|nr:hypothetical protein TEA_009722 [Camellia sinensis var. sinensis]